MSMFRELAIPAGSNEVYATVQLNTAQEVASYLQSFPKDAYFGKGAVGDVAAKLHDGTRLTEDDERALKNLLPLSVGATKIVSKELAAGEHWNLSTAYGDVAIMLEIDKLTMPTGSYISCTNKSLNLVIHELIKTDVQHAATVNYDIGIFGAGGQPGSGGQDGAAGAHGVNGKDGQNWSPGIAGDNGQPGTNGADGGSGTSGLNGHHGSGVITSTIAIQKLDRPVTIAAMPGHGGNGGNGGKGGNGGNGGKGGKGCDTACEGSNGGNGGNGGKGGNGGNGGDGGNGGSGGTVNVYVSPGSKAKVVALCDVPHGGNRGVEGMGGAVGAGGDGGAGGKHHYGGNAGAKGTTVGNNGTAGVAGSQGTKATINVSEKVF